MAHPEGARRALVVYGSDTGNAQDVAEELARLAVRLHFGTDIAELDAVSLNQLVQYHVVLVAISTTGHGDLPSNSQAFWRAIRNVRLGPACLQHMKFASFGLGDSSYPKFNWAHRKLYNRLLQLGARPVCPRGESDEQQPDGIDGSFVPWSIQLRQCLLEQYPLPDSLEPIPDHVLLDPNWLLDFAHHNGSSTNGTTQLPTAVDATPQPPSSAEIPPPDLLSIPNGITATITANDRITPQTHWQHVRHLKLSTPSSAAYVPGSTLTIYPKNFPIDVDEFLRIMSWTSIADDPLRFVPTNPDLKATKPPINTTGELTLRKLLTNHLGILSIPRRSFFAQLAHFTTDPFQRDRLLEFADAQYIDELYDYTTRPRRSILEVLQEFDTVKLPWQRICSLVPMMRGRQFSIASACTGTGNVELLIAIVKYKTVIKRIRQGVCTRYVAALAPNAQITVTIQKGGLGVSQRDIQRPVVMVGPGTGIAPMRSLVYQRMIWRQASQGDDESDPKQPPINDMLFFGCRNENADYFFKNEWNQLRAQGVPLDIFTAFSRDQRQKIYVQDLLRNQSTAVFHALGKANGILYICGSAGKMPLAVREALIHIFQTHAHWDREAAERYLATMDKQGRYKQETW